MSGEQSDLFAAAAAVRGVASCYEILVKLPDVRIRQVEADVQEVQSQRGLGIKIVATQAP